MGIQVPIDQPMKALYDQFVEENPLEKYQEYYNGQSLSTLIRDSPFNAENANLQFQ